MNLVKLVASFLYGMAADKHKVDNDCAAYGMVIFEHMVKILGWSETETVSHWEKEVLSFLTRFEYVAKFKVKEKQIYKNLFLDFNLESYYEDAEEKLSEKPNRTLEEVEPLIEAFYQKLCKDLTDRLNLKSSSSIVRWKKADMERWLS